jgi:hypothetical protein
MLAHLVRRPWKNKSNGDYNMKPVVYVAISIFFLVAGVIFMSATCESNNIYGRRGDLEIINNSSEFVYGCTIYFNPFDSTDNMTIDDLDIDIGSSKTITIPRNYVCMEIKERRYTG